MLLVEQTSHLVGLEKAVGSSAWAVAEEQTYIESAVAGKPLLVEQLEETLWH